MKKVKSTVAPNNVDTLESIKKLTVTAMFSDDELFDHLVLKGGNAMDLVHRLSNRASIDLDFSMKHDFPEGVNGFCDRVERALSRNLCFLTKLL
jgi:predicted nucleotidyltransferase component of viral defense system